MVVYIATCFRFVYVCRKKTGENGN